MKNLRVLALLIISVLAISSCATVVKETYSHTGAKAFTADCSDGDFGTLTMSECYKAAGDKCGNRGYSVFQTSDTPDIHGLRTRSIVFSCKQ